MLDIFNNNAFSVISLTDAINNMKFVPGRVGQLGIFTPSGVATTSIAIEERDGQLVLIAPTPRGGPGHTFGARARRLRALAVPHFEINDAVMADQVQGVRAWGSETEVETVQGIVAERLAVHTQSFAATQEYSRIGAVKGTVVYADGSTIDLFGTFGVSAQTEVPMDLENTATDGRVRKKLADVSRALAGVLDGIPYTGMYALCGDAFFDDLISNAEVRQTYLNWAAAQELRAGYVEPTSAQALSYASFPYGGVVWDNYRGKVGGTSFIDTDHAYMFPMGVPQLFRTYYAPADYIETVNTIGQRLYSKQYVMENGKGVNLDTQMNALDICTRPGSLLTLHRGT